jgi:hypothetical protein
LITGIDDRHAVYDNLAAWRHSAGRAGLSEDIAGKWVRQ